MSDPEASLQTKMLNLSVDYPAPDGSEIRMLPTVKGGGLCHCTLPVGRTSAPVAHRQVEEIWYVLGGEGEIWRKNAAEEETVRVCPGASLTIPPCTAFQFRNTGDDPLCILIATMPPWPGREEAEQAEGVWPATVGADAGAAPKGGMNGTSPKAEEGSGCP